MQSARPLIAPIVLPDKTEQASHGDLDLDLDDEDLFMIEPTAPQLVVKAEGAAEAEKDTENPETIIFYFNKIIEFVNGFRERKARPIKDKTSNEDLTYQFRKKNPSATITDDIGLRERIVSALLKNEAQGEMQANYGSNNEFVAIGQKFFDHRHDKFLHLTAYELAAVGMAVDMLLRLISLLLSKINDRSLQNMLQGKQQDLMTLRGDVVSCMNYHAEVFEENDKKSGDTASNSDLLIYFRDEMQRLTGAKLDGTEEFLPDMQNLWPDTSYWAVAPEARELPFLPAGEPQMVRDFFREYASHPYIESLEMEWKLSDFEFFNDAKGSDVTGRARSGLFSCFFPWSVRAAVPADVQTTSDKSESAPSEPIDMSVLLPTDILTKINETLEQLKPRRSNKGEQIKICEGYYTELEWLQGELTKEISELTESCCGCAGFFRGRTLKLKHAKLAAITRILEQSTTPQSFMQAIAHEVNEGPSKDLVLAGWKSRTNEKLTRMLARKELQELLQNPEMDDEQRLKKKAEQLEAQGAEGVDFEVGENDLRMV